MVGLLTLRVIRLDETHPSGGRMTWFFFKKIIIIFVDRAGRSSNGRTHPSGGCYLGSSPSLPALPVNSAFSVF